MSAGVDWRVERQLEYWRRLELNASVQIVLLFKYAIVHKRRLDIIATVAVAAAAAATAAAGGRDHVKIGPQRPRVAA